MYLPGDRIHRTDWVIETCDTPYQRSEGVTAWARMECFLGKADGAGGLACVFGEGGGGGLESAEAGSGVDGLVEGGGDGGVGWVVGV